MRFLILGLDERPGRSKPGYTDTIILVSVSSLKRNLITMSIPRDLWIQTSNREGSRIGAVYTAIETKETGKGANAITALISKSFQIPVYYYVLADMQGFIKIIDSLSGVDIVLSRPIAGYLMGITHLDGRAALAFVRDRNEIDDFSRMLQAQILINGIISKFFEVKTWSKLPQVLNTLRGATKSNVPFWKWPQFAFTIPYSYFKGIESYTITRDMVSPTITSQGEYIMKPDWDKIRVLTRRVFDK